MQNENARKLLIGVTGGIGSGKTLACSYFERLGCEIFYADDIAKQLYGSSDELKRELVKQFGTAILDDKGSISFGTFRKVIFSSDANQKQVNKIVHPYVINEILARAENYPGRLVIIEAALIFESGFDKCLDYTIVISSTAKNRIRRVKNRSELKIRDIRSIMRLQMPEAEKKSKADFVIKNDSSPRELEKKINFVFSVLNKLK